MEPKSSNTVSDVAKVNEWVMSGKLDNWMKAAASPVVTYRQLAHMAKRLADVREAKDSGARVADCARLVLRHDLADERLAKLLLDSSYALVWLEVLWSCQVTEEMTKQIHLKNEADFRRMVREPKHEQMEAWKLMLLVRRSLSEAKVANAEALDELARIEGTNHWLKVAASEMVGEQTLWYMVKRLQVEPDRYEALDELLEALLRRGDLSAELRRAVSEIQEYAQLVTAVQDQTLSEAELLAIAKKLAATKMHPRQVGDAALGLSWHTNATAAVMTELAKSTESMAMYCVAQAELTDAQTLNVLARNAELMRYRNPLFQMATVKEIIRHPNVTDEVVQTLVSATTDRWVWEVVTFAYCAERDTLRLIVDKISNEHDKDAHAVWMSWSSIMESVLLHPHLDKELKQYIVERNGKDGMLWSIMQHIDENGAEWQGYNLAERLPRMDWVVRMTAWEHLTRDLSDSGGIIYPVWFKKILQSEYLTVDYLDQIVQIFAFKTDRIMWDDDLRVGKRERAFIVKVLEMLWSSPCLTDASRDVLLEIKGRAGDELRRLAKNTTVKVS